MPFGPFILQWRTPHPNPPIPLPLPPDLKRHTLPTPSGPLELLQALPSSSSSSSHSHPLPPLLFAHGGFGCAAFWVPYMRFFAARGFRCYAVSYRGHGASWYPGFWRLWWTGRAEVAGDLAEAVGWVERLEGEEVSCSRDGEEEVRGGDDDDDDDGDGVVDREDGKVVIIAHSAGALLTQWLLSRGLVRAKGVCIFAGIPGFGSFKVFRFWLPTALPNFIYRLFHPRYMLATLPQIRAAFFTPSTPLSTVRNFAKLLSPYESMLWPLQSLRAFVTGEDVLGSITGWVCSSRGERGESGKEIVNSDSGEKEKHDEQMTQDEKVPTAEKNPITKVRPALLILAAQLDVLCTPAILRDAAQRYRDAFKRMLERGGIAGLSSPANDFDESERVERMAEEAVEFKIVEGVPHHLQNCEEWEKGAEVLEAWLGRLLAV